MNNNSDRFKKLKNRNLYSFFLCFISPNKTKKKKKKKKPNIRDEEIEIFFTKLEIDVNDFKGIDVLTTALKTKKTTLEKS